MTPRVAWMKRHQVALYIAGLALGAVCELVRSSPVARMNGSLRFVISR